ncbi:HXXEE domain-containing protein [Dyella amyloliquefaciens]|uniref:HXXEE domain-containing protein n=1 Tax=Dyella amyloliquefaciens TaxID=1770545 RepID=UPI00102E2C34|nr:HXXEE domain-containing protein [Dyella amyloliquefaciens]
MRATVASAIMVISMHSRFERLLWLMPVAYAIHIGDEWFSGFPRYVVDHMGGHPMPPALFFANNACFMLVLLALCTWASRSTSRLSAFLLMSWASGNLFWNFVAHLFYTVHTGAYSPGLVTSSLFYYPVSLLVVAASVRDKRMSVTGALGAFAIGGALLVLVIWGGVYHFAT